MLRRSLRPSPARPLRASLGAGPRPARGPRAGWRRVTLVELLVAVALSVILIGVMTFVWIQSNNIFSTQLNRIETYQRVRNILDTIERDLANTQLTTDMEFFEDKDGNGFFDPSAPIPADRDAPLLSPGGSSGTGAGGFMRDPVDRQDPLWRMGTAGSPAPEFGVEPTDELNTGIYQRAPFILSPEPYLIDEQEGYLESTAYWRDEIYVRSFITIGDSNRPALIHYRLVQPTPGGRSLLRRRIWFLHADGTLKDETDQVDIRAVDVCDLKVSFLFKDNPISGEAHVYHAQMPDPDIAGYSDDRIRALLEQEVARGYVSAFRGRPDNIPTGDPPSGNAKGVPSLSTQHELFTDRVPFLYSGVAKLEEQELKSAALRTLDSTLATEPDATEFEMTAGSPNYNQYGHFDFPGVRTGSGVLLFEASDDDGTTIGDRKAGTRFPARVFTIDSLPFETAESSGPIVLGSQDNFVSIRFLEKIPFARLRTSWLGAEDEISVPGAAGTKQGPKRKLLATFNVKYRVGFLPSAFVVRLSVDDRFNQQVIPMERVVRLLQQ